MDVVTRPEPRHSIADTRSEGRWHRATILFLVVTTLLRLLQLPTLELAPDEAYYWDWSRRLSLGYYDQGPFIAYLIRATTAVFGTNEFGVRFGALLCSLGTLICCYILARRLFSPRAGFYAVLLLGLTPFLEIGSIIATYDPPLVFFWALAVLVLERALFAPDERTQRRAWFGAGLAVGLGFLSKHTMLFLVPCLLLFLILSPPHRRWLTRPEPYLAFALCLLLYSGVLYWNAQNHWWTFGHLLFLSKKTFGSPLSRLGDFIGSQALLLGPVLFPMILWACWKGVGNTDERPTTNDKRQRREPDTRYQEPATKNQTPESDTLFLLCMGLPVFLLFCLMAFKAKVQANWGPCAWLTPTILLAGVLSERESRKARRLVTLAAVTSGLLTVLIVSPELRYRLGIRLSVLADHTNTMYGWREIAAQVQKLREEGEKTGRKVFIASDGYQYTALLAFYLPDHPETFDLFLHGRLTMYAAYVERLKTHLGEDAIFVNDNRSDESDLGQIFERVEWTEAIPVWRRPYYDAPIRTMEIARCRNYRRYTGLEWTEGG
jgi:hypothetical protein